MASHNIGSKEVDIAQELNRCLVVTGADGVDFQRALADMDRDRAAELVSGRAHGAQQIWLASIDAVRGESHSDAPLGAFIIAMKHFDRAVETCIGALTAIGGPAIGINTELCRRPLIGTAVGAKSHLVRDIKEEILIDPPHVQDCRGPGHDQPQHGKFDNRALLVLVQRFHRKLAHRQQETVDVVAPERRLADVFNEAPEDRGAEAVIVDVDKAWQD